MNAQFVEIEAELDDKEWIGIIRLSDIKGILLDENKKSYLCVDRGDGCEMFFHGGENLYNQIKTNLKISGTLK